MPAPFPGSIPAVLAAALLPFLVSAAAAQPTAPDTPPPGQEQPAPGAGAQPDEACTARPGGGQNGATGDGQSLTGQLADCNGVLTPPPMPGNDMQAPVPDADPGTTPVLPPGTVPAQPAQ